MKPFTFIVVVVLTLAHFVAMIALSWWMEHR